MRPLPRYWAQHHDTVDIPGRGQFDLRITGQSPTSQEEAEQDARRRFDQLIAQGGPKVGGGYEYYPDRYRPEEVLEEVHSPDGDLIAVVTRNRYGAAVLNTDAVLITDIDIEARPAARGRSGGFLSRLFGRGGRGADGADGADPDEHGLPGHGARGAEHERILQGIAAFGAAHPELGLRVYRTRNGFRMLVSGAGASPAGDRAKALMSELRSDELYMLLCRVHETYRARLTPKPWRVGVKAQSRGGPWMAELDQYQQWLTRYATASQEYAVCRLVSESGPAPTAVEQQVIELHDRAVRPTSQLRLA